MPLPPAHLPRSDYLKRLKGAQRPLVIVGPGVLQRADRDAVLQKVGPCFRLCVEQRGAVERPCQQVAGGRFH